MDASDAARPTFPSSAADRELTASLPRPAATPDGERRSLTRSRGGVLAAAGGLAALLVGAWRRDRATLQETSEERRRLLEDARLARADADAARRQRDDMLDTMTDVVAGYDRDLRIIYLNAAARAVVASQHRPLDSVLNQYVWDAYPELVDSPFARALTEAYTSRVATTIEQYFAPRLHWYRLRVFPLRDGGLTTVWENITAERATADRAARLLALTQALLSTTTATDVAATILEQGQAALGASAGTVFARDPEAPELILVGASGLSPSVLDGWDRVSIDRAGPVTDALRSAESLFFRRGDDFVARYPELAAAYAEASGVSWAVLPLSADGDVIGVLTFGFPAERAFSDEERAFMLALAAQGALALDRARLFEGERQAHAEAEQARERLATVFAQAPVSIAVHRGPEHVIEAFNASYRQISGPRALIGRTAREAFPELELQGLLAQLDGVYRTGVPFVGTETPVYLDRTGDGNLQRGYYNFVYQPLTDDAGTVDGIVVVGVDVSKLVASRFEADQARVDAERARADAEIANRSKSDFLATMSHELRTPLNAIGGYADLLLTGVRGALSPEQADDVRRMQRAGRHLLGLINDVLNYTRLEASQIDVRHEPFRLADVLDEANAMIEPQARTKSIAFERAVVDPRALAAGDRDKVLQIVLNVLTNAVKFTRGGGRVTVRVWSDGDPIRVAVSDTGRGIPADQLGAIFEPFVQVGRKLSGVDEGAGLGLSISRGLARAMGGELTVESTPNVGSTFTLTLCRAADVVGP